MRLGQTLFRNKLRRNQRVRGATNDGEPLQRADVADWLSACLKPGDLVLSGSRDSLSRLIRWGTMSHYSHVALALSENEVIESYDWEGTPAEDDGGVSRLSIAGYSGRGSLLHLAILRPQNLDPDRFRDVTSRATHFSPAFPSSTAIMLALAGFGDHPRVRIPGARRYVEKRLHLLGDGAGRVTCAEFAARVYLEAGVPLRFQTLRLLLYVEMLGPHEPESLHTRSARRPSLDEQTNAASRPTTLIAFVAGFPRAVLASARDQTTPDWADLLMPGDFLRSSNFDVVAVRSVHA